jgi:alpha-beta hydrolase superfamily lysophospholipase
MKHVDGRFKGVRNHNIYYQAWLPDGNVKAVLFLVHGLGEYCGRFANLVNHYVPLGYAVYGLDHLGHGKSDGEREVIERFDDFTDPMRLYYQMVKGWQPGKPVFIFGHSMGGLITCCYLLDRQEDFQGAIISAPAIKVSDNISSVTVIMGKILSRIAPKVGVVSLDPNCISRDSEVVRTYVKDPLVFHGKTPARLAGEMLKVMMHVRAELDKITLPFIVVQGGEDKLVDPKGAQMLYDRAGSKDKTLKIYKGLYHEIHNEPERSTMFKDVEAWLSVRV